MQRASGPRRSAGSETAIRGGPSAARPAFVRAALLAGVGLGALAVSAPDGAYAVDGIWLGGQPPSVTEWNQGSNWSSNPAVPDDIATFTSGVNTTVTNFGSAAINTIQFDFDRTGLLVHELRVLHRQRRRDRQQFRIRAELYQ